MRLILDYGSDNEYEFLFGAGEDGDYYDNEVDEPSWSVAPMITLGDHPENGKCEYLLFESSENAGEAARDYWEDMANNDLKELACIIGDEVLIQWGLGQSAGPGYSKVRGLDEWLDLWLDTPEEQWAGYDGEEVECMIDQEMCEALGWEWDANKNDETLMDCVMYRTN